MPSHKINLKKKCKEYPCALSIDKFRLNQSIKNKFSLDEHEKSRRTDLNTLLSKFFCYVTWLLYQLIRCDTGRLAKEVFTSNSIVSSKQYLNGLKATNWTGVTDFLYVHGTICALILFIWGAVLFLYIQCYLLAYSVPLVCLECNLHALNAIYVSQVLLKCLHSKGILMCSRNTLCNAIKQTVLEMSCGFSLFPHFQITFPSV